MSNDLALPQEQIKLAVEGSEILGFDETKISVRSIRSVLKEKGKGGGENKQLGIVI